MYGFGDHQNPLPESIEDFLKALEGDNKKIARAHELLNLDKELKAARATFGDAVQLEKASENLAD
ncbi:hypothetical protein HDV02_002346 [Globomyces sp. JEL0801]|nr:hypothetical protein HDV02_002346 [Globomyces sp. JEL0801]